MESRGPAMEMEYKRTGSYGRCDKWTRKRRLLWMILSRPRVLLLMLISGTVVIYASSKSMNGFETIFRNGTVATFHYVDESFSEVGSRDQRVILITYGRSGSSFTSAIIQHSQDVFYTFEPLYNLMRRTIGIEKARNQFWIPISSRSSFDEESVRIMETFLTCSFESMNVSDIDNFQLRNSLDSRMLWTCAQSSSNFTPINVIDCFIKTRDYCLSRRVKMVKTIRLRGTAVAQLLRKHPDIKVLYLIRDPRGTIESQKRVFGNFEWENVTEFSRNYCANFREDLNAMEPLFDEYPKNMKLLRYETLAESPLKVSEELYAFLQLNFTAATKEYIVNKTAAGMSSRSAYGTTRANSSAAAYNWRRHISLEAAQVIDSNCKDIYDKLGYLPVLTKEQLESNQHSLKVDVVFKGTRL